MFETQSSKKAPIAGDLYLCFAGRDSTVARRSFPQTDTAFTNLQPTSLYRIPFGASGQYIAYDLREGYHCTQPISHTSIMREKALSAKIEVVFPDRSGGPHHFPGVFSSFNNFDSVWNEEWEQYHSSYPWKEVGLCLLQSDAGKKPCERKNFAQCSGYTGLNASTDSDDITARPSVLTSTNKDKVQRMCQATYMLRRLLQRNNLPFPHQIDPERNSEFALGLCRLYDIPETDKFLNEVVPSNIFEFLTDAALVIPINDIPVNINGNIIENTMQVRWHLDEFNCPYIKLVFVLYKHVWFDEYKCWIRISSIFTFRKAISDYYLRRDRAGVLSAQLILYYRANQDRHNIVSPPSPSSTNIHQCVTRLPCYNKLAGFHSCFATPIVWFIEKYRRTLTLEQVCEILVPVGFLRGPSLFYRIVSSWSRSSLLGFDGGKMPNKTRSGNLTLEYIHATIEFGGINSGPGPRHQPKVNGSFVLKQVQAMCHAVRQAVESTYSDPLPCYSQLRSLLAAAPFFGHLGAQHIIAAASCAGLLRGGIDYLRQGDVCHGTAAYESITKSYGLSEYTVNCAYRTTAALLDVPPFVMEEVGCRLAKECKQIPKNVASVSFDPSSYQPITSVTIGYDVQFPGQYTFSVARTSIVRCHEELVCRSGKTVQREIVVSFIKLERLSNDPWEAMKETCSEVPTSATSSLPDNVVVTVGKTSKKIKRLNIEPEEKHDSTYRGHVRRDTVNHLHRLSQRMSTRNGLPFNHRMFAEANRNDKTRIHMAGLLLIVCEGSKISKKNTLVVHTRRTKKRTRGYRKPCLTLSKERNTKGVEKHACRLTHLMGDQTVVDACVAVDSHFALKFGQDGHSADGEALYRTPKAAARALVVFCLFHMPYVNGKTTGRIPTWLHKHSETAKCKGSVFIFLHDVPILVGSSSKGDYKQSVLLGSLSFVNSERYIFSFPKDDWEQNIDFETSNWQMCDLCPPSWLCLLGSKIVPPATLLGRSVKTCDKGVWQNLKVFSYGSFSEVDDETDQVSNVPSFNPGPQHPCEKKYLLQYEDGERRICSVEEVISLLGIGRVPLQP